MELKHQLSILRRKKRRSTLNSSSKIATLSLGATLLQLQTLTAIKSISCLNTQ